jgi:hypothetical protein
MFHVKHFREAFAGKHFTRGRRFVGKISPLRPATTEYTADSLESPGE